MSILKEYHFYDMILSYLLDEESQTVELQILPKSLAKPCVVRNHKPESLVQLKLTGDIYNEAYAMGNSMRNSETVRSLKYQKQMYTVEQDVHRIDTVLADERRHQVTHHLTWKEGTPYVRICCTFENLNEESCTLELFESFSLGGLSPYLEGDGHDSMRIHRFRSVWSQEGRHECIAVEDLQLEPAWGPHAVRCEKFGQVGSMPVNKFFPFAAVEDTVHQVFWGAQIAHPASWQMELYRKDDGLALSGGLADRDFGQWMKKIDSGESFTTPEAIVSAAHTDSIDIFTNRLVKAAEESMAENPEMEKDLPIIFNEYCTTWGSPSHENICGILEAIKGKPFRYFVIDCGWYREEGVPWDISMGDYMVSKELFPDGLDKTTQAIRDAGMIPGIWFEFETAGRASRIYQNTDHLLHKDGAVLTSYFRRFLNMNDPWVEQYLTEKVIGTLNTYGFGYMKVDYNETIGAGCDGAESIGEGLRRNMEATLRFFDKIKREVPEIVLENCSSGGHRLEPSFMAECSMASFSDAHECEEIPIIAANLHRVIHPAQSQIWSVIRETDSRKRVAYSVANTFLGRMCISGDVTKLSQEQWALIDEGMEFYQEIAPIIRCGQSYRYGTKIRSVRHAQGWQGLVRVGENGEAYAVIHTFDGELPQMIELELPKDAPERIARVYSDENTEIYVENHVLKLRPEANKRAVAVHLKK